MTSEECRLKPTEIILKLMVYIKEKGLAHFRANRTLSHIVGALSCLCEFDEGTSEQLSVESIGVLSTGRIETAQEWLGHSSTAHTRAYIDAEDYREKANGVVAGLDI
jgi:hypothetical protein